MDDEKPAAAGGQPSSVTGSVTGESGPPLLVRIQGSEWSLPAGRSYLVGRDPGCDIVVADGRVSWRHAVLRLEEGRWVLADNGSTNGVYAGDHRVSRVEISGQALIRLSHPYNGPALNCTVTPAVSTLRTGRAPDHDIVVPAVAEPASAAPPPPGVSPPAVPPGDGPLEIRYAVRWLVPKGERFANFDILNDNDTQLDYYRRFGHIYAVGIPTKKWRLVVVSDPELLDEVAADEEQFGKHVEEINFFDQLSNSRGGGISVIGDGDHYEQVRRVMLPWYAPSHQRTQLERMKEQAGKLVAAWSAIGAGELLDARAWMERYTLEVSGRGACAYNFGLLDGPSDQHRDPHPFAVAYRRAPRRASCASPSPARTSRSSPAARGASAGRPTAATTRSWSAQPTPSCAPGCTRARSGRRRTCSAGW
jgi:Inner membrane component of T3SS, cytoplasmic domain/Cytochrome P450